MREQLQEDAVARKWSREYYVMVGVNGQVAALLSKSNAVCT